MNSNKRPRARDVGISFGFLPTGIHNAITDVAGVKVGHCTLIRGEGARQAGVGPVRTGVTAILPHDGDLFEDKVAAVVHVVNGFGKAMGIAQIQELALRNADFVTNTLNVGKAAMPSSIG
jgi:D-aminopeptidase